MINLKIEIKNICWTNNGCVIIKCENVKEIDILKLKAEDILTNKSKMFDFIHQI